MSVITRLLPENSKIRVLSPKVPHDRISFRTNKGLLIRSWADILHCRASSNYTEIFFADGEKQILCKTLVQVQNKLPAKHFVRVHQSHLVNISAVRWVTKGSIEINTGLTLPLSRSKQREIENLLLAETSSL